MGQTKKKCKKAERPSEKRSNMGWTELPQGVIEKIIAHAVKGVKKETEPEFNWFLMRVVKYGQVNPAWKEAIRFSRNIFSPNLEDDQMILIGFAN